MSIQSELLQNVLVSITEKLSIKKWRYKIQSIPENAVNYIGNIIPVTLIDETSDVTTHLVIKADSALVKKFEPVVKGAYEREVYFYNALVPLYEKHIGISDFIPKCYYADSTKGNRVVVLQNMTEKGYRRHDGGRFLDEKHSTVTLQTVAKLHSYSMILQAKNIKPENDHVMDPFCLTSEPMYFESLQKCFKQYGVDIFMGTQHEEFFESVYDKIKNMKEFSKNCLINSRTLVFGHCDMWKENFLFKYSDNNPVQVCLLDYQMCHLISPAYDVLFQTMSSIDSTVRRKYYHELLSTYYKALDRCLQDNGVDSSKVYSENDFHEDLKLLFPLCFSVSVFSFALWLGLADLSELLGSASTSTSKELNNNTQMFKEIIRNVIADFRDFGVID